MKLIEDLNINGFSISTLLFSSEEIEKLKSVLENINADGKSFRKTEDLFAIRRFLQEVPEVQSILFNDSLKSLISDILPNAFAVRSIYFDKPPASNWFVAWHQDLTISVQGKRESNVFVKWTNKDGNWAVQAPVNLLENIFTIRIHLDDTTADNGALHVIPASHVRGYIRPEEITESMKATTYVCEVKAGGVMLMKPLLLHASGRSTGNARRRVIHIEFSDAVLPDGLLWSEKVNI